MRGSVSPQAQYALFTVQTLPAWRGRSRPPQMDRICRTAPGRSNRSLVIRWLRATCKCDCAEINADSVDVLVAAQHRFHILSFPRRLSSNSSRVASAYRCRNILSSGCQHAVKRGKRMDDVPILSPFVTSFQIEPAKPLTAYHVVGLGRSAC